MRIGSIEMVLVVLAVVCSIIVHLLTAYLTSPPMKKVMLGGLLAYGFGACAIIAAIITPPDVISMLIIMLPLGFLFLICAAILVAVRHKQVAKGE